MKKLLLITIVAAIAYVGGTETGFIPASGGDSVTNASAADDIIAAAFDDHRSDVQVRGTGEVLKMLGDDNHGSRHQRFVVRLASGQSLLVAHNIDLAGRVATLKVGDEVEFNGEYEWNAKGGVIHWTHHDPQGEHSPGWIKHNGRTYQ